FLGVVCLAIVHLCRVVYSLNRVSISTGQDHTKAMRRIDKSLNPFSLFSQGNGWLTCEPEPSSACPAMACGDHHWAIVDTERNLYMAINYTRDHNGKAKFTKDDPIAKLLRLSYITPVITYNEAFKRSRLTNYRKAPENLRNNVSAYFTFQDPKFSDYLISIVPNCSRKFNDDIISLGVQTNEERAELELVTLVEIVNGRISSQYVNKDFLPAGTRQTDGTYYTQVSLDAIKAFRAGTPKTISQKQAASLFAKAKKLQGMAWDRPEMANFARAERMTAMMAEEGVSADKAWITGNLKSPSTGTKWSNHVAAVVYIKNGKGKAEARIIDPIVAEQPVTTTEWFKLLGVYPGLVDTVGFPPPIEASHIAKTSFTITNRRAFHLSFTEKMTDEARLSEAKKQLAALK
ncbi:protein-glutamine glutaminase family protein, partial [Alcanivorax sp. DP30]|uniref:protein-glutamine glutaminase family protein n=1 Tax=Alcanivorax sp. DP30 TaxID=2606217 RepID=UPI00136A4E78